MADGSQGTALIESPRSGGLGSVRVVQDFIPVLDTARFEHMQRIASVMAEMSVVPDSLRGSGPRQTIANCFMVVNQATRWGMDPFAVVACCSVVKGRLTYEGKLVAAVLDAKLGVRLTYKWSGEGEQMAIEVSGTLPDGVIETIEGTVTEWKTTGNGSPWRPATYKKMLAYRGAREWARLYAPAVMLGVYSDDEMEGLTRTPLPPAPPAPPPAPQIRHDVVDVPPTPPDPGRPPSPRAVPSAPARATAGASVAPPSPSRPAAGPPPAPKAPPSPPPAPLDLVPEPQEPDAPVNAEAVLDHIADELGACGDTATLDETWGGFDELLGRLTRTDRERAGAVYDEHARRLAP